MLQGAVRRSDQRTKGQLYVRGLLTDGARKSMQPMAARLGVDHQGLQQFISSSTWDYEAVRANVARWAVDVIDPGAYVVDDTGFPKDGTASPCVARQYSGTLGKTGNWGLPKLPVVADCGYGDCTAFRLGLAERGLSYIVEVDGTPAPIRTTPPREPPLTAGGAAHLAPPTPTNTPTCAPWPWPPGSRRCAPSPGAEARKPGRPIRARRCAPASWPSGSGPPTATSPEPTTAACRRAC